MPKPPLASCQFGIGPMSKNVVDACIEWANTRDRGLILIPSRRQIEWDGGYSNEWTTAGFAAYVRERTDRIWLQRDHGGPRQGAVVDSGMASLGHDCHHLDLIHIDPWVDSVNFGQAFLLTEMLIQHCHHVNPLIEYEIGTEQSIFPYSAGELECLIVHLKQRLTADQFERVRYAVIQSGTSLSADTNTGHFDEGRLKDMISVCERHGLLSKEHNGDFLSTAQLRGKLALGLTTVNIAPEFGQIETGCYMEAMLDKPDLCNQFYHLCFDSRKWVKWFPGSQPTNGGQLVHVCGHYLFSHPTFVSEIKPRLGLDIDHQVQHAFVQKLDQLHGLTA